MLLTPLTVGCLCPYSELTIRVKPQLHTYFQQRDDEQVLVARVKNCFGRFAV